MPLNEKESSSDMELVVKQHNYSTSDVNRSHVPMWDSSDPDRAPPPLPLNPSSPTPKARANASPGIQATAATLTERMRDSAPSTYTSNSMTLKSSPEKSLIKGQYHKRMQSLQNGTDTRSEFRNYLENRSPERPSRSSLLDLAGKPREQSPTRTSSLASRDTGRSSPSLHVSSRYLSKPILGESTPPSATMLALQNMQVPTDADPPISSASSSITVNSTGQSMEALSAQILSLTSIATSLQKEMTQLTRRSKDNATDLLSLKAATNARDEDIRKSIRDLSSNISSKFLEPEAAIARATPSLGFGGSSYSLDNKPYDNSPGSRKSYTIPRVASPGSFASALERDVCASPAPISDGSASIALLEKVLREMATKEAQEKLMELMDEVNKRPAKAGADKDADKNISKMLEEILNLVRDNPANSALVRSMSNENARSSRALAGVGNQGEPYNARLELPDDVMAILKRVRNSVAEGGGLTNEVKALVRELRGEVLGMGREIARKLEEVSTVRKDDGETKKSLDGDDISTIIQAGLAELKIHMTDIIQNHHQELSASIARGTPDSTEVYTAVKAAMEEFPLPQLPAPASAPAPAPLPSSVGMEKEDILETVREAWETYKPEIELQNFGLERDEILDCLKEGLKDYQPSIQFGEIYEQVLAAVQTGLHDFVPPPIHASITKEDIVASVREALESSEFPTSRSLQAECNSGINRDEIAVVLSEVLSEVLSGHNNTVHPALGEINTREGFLNAVTEALAAHHAATREIGESNATKDDITNAINEAFASQNAVTREIELNKEDLFEAVTAGLQEAAGASNFNVGEQVLERLQEIVDGMKEEFKEYSAASGRDTEQVLDALKDGMEVLRSEIESYVDRAADVTGKDEIIDTVKDGFRLLQADLERSIHEAAVGSSSSRGNPDTPELLDAMDKEFEHLRQTLSSLLIKNTASSEKDEILEAIREIHDTSARGHGTDEVAKVIRDEFENLRDALGSSLVRSDPSGNEEVLSAIKDSIQNLQNETMFRRDGSESTMTSASELLDAFNEGLDAIRGELEGLIHRPVENSSSEILETLSEGLASIKQEMEALRSSQKEFEELATNHGREVMLANERAVVNDIESVKVLITQLQIKLEAMDSSSHERETSHNDLKKEHIDEVLAAVREVHGSVAEVGAREIPIDSTAARKEDTDAIETLLRNTKAKIDEIPLPAADEMVKTEHILALEMTISEIRESVNELSTRLESENPTKSELGALESILKDVWVAVDDLKNKDENSEEVSQKVSKNDIQAVEALVFAVKTQLDELKLPDVEELPTKSDIQELNVLVNEFKEKVESEAEMTAQAFESRKVEHGGLADKIEEAKVVVADLRDELKSKLEGSEEGLSEVKRILEGLSNSAETFSTVESISELNELVCREFERARAEQDIAKLEVEERDAAALIKQDETRAAILVDVGAKLDEKVAELLSKYDEIQTNLDSKFTEVEARDIMSIENTTSTKTIAEDLKLVIGAMSDNVSEACQRMSDDAKTFFDKVDESYNKMEEMHSQLRTGHEKSQADLRKTAEATDRVETQILEYHPQILSAIKDVLLIVGQHYEHSQKSTQEIKTDLSALPSAIPPLLPALPSPESRDISDSEKLVNREVHHKLDTLLGHVETVNQSMTQMRKVDEIHEKVLATSQEVSEMVATQSRLIVEDYERKKRESEEAALALEKRLSQKEKVEADILGLNDEKESLLNIIQTLKQEKEQLTKENTRLNKELSGLETALEIRHEEMQVMEDRAEMLEKRILEGVLDHARSILLSRPGSSAQGMNLKRVASYASTATKTSRASTVSTAKDSRSLVSSGVGMALKRRSPAKSSSNNSTTAGSSTPGKERRILSLSHVTGNRGSTDRQMVLAPSANGGLTNLKRSHSVKSNLMPSRKASWNRRSSVHNKENEHLPEEEENDSGEQSDTGTERRTSYTGTYTDSMLYGTGSTVSTNRQASFTSSVNGLVAEHNGSILEEEEEEETTNRGEDVEDEEEDGEDDDFQSTMGDENGADLTVSPEDQFSELGLPPKIKDIHGPGHSDSGIGTEIASSVNT